MTTKFDRLTSMLLQLWAERLVGQMIAATNYGLADEMIDRLGRRIVGGSRLGLEAGLELAWSQAPVTCQSK